MDIFSSLKPLVPHWVGKSSRHLTYEEIQSVLYAEIVESQYGYSVLFHLNTGKPAYIPLSNQSFDIANVGDVVDPSTIKVLTLEMDGDPDHSTIIRIEL